MKPPAAAARITIGTASGRSPTPSCSRAELNAAPANSSCSPIQPIRNVTCSAVAAHDPATPRDGRSRSPTGTPLSAADQAAATSRIVAKTMPTGAASINCDTVRPASSPLSRSRPATSAGVPKATEATSTANSAAPKTRSNDPIGSEDDVESQERWATGAV